MSTRTLFLSCSTLFMVAFGVLPYIAAEPIDADPPKTASPTAGGAANSAAKKAEPAERAELAERDDQLEPDEPEPYEPGREIGLSTGRSTGEKPASKPMPPAIAEILRIRAAQGSVLSGSILEDGGEGPAFSEALQRASNTTSKAKPIPAKSDYPHYTKRGPGEFFANPPAAGDASNNGRPVFQPATPPVTNPRVGYPQTQPHRYPYPPVQSTPPRVANIPTYPAQPPPAQPQPVQSPTSGYQQPRYAPSNSAPSNSAPSNSAPTRASGELIQSLRNSARLLEKQAHSLESAGQNDAADKFCMLAHRIRKQIRQLQAQSSQPNSARYGRVLSPQQQPPVSPYTPIPKPENRQQPTATLHT